MPIVETAPVDGIGSAESDQMLVVEEDGKSGTEDASARRNDLEGSLKCHILIYEYSARYNICLG